MKKIEWSNDVGSYLKIPFHNAKKYSEFKTKICREGWSFGYEFVSSDICYINDPLSDNLGGHVSYLKFQRVRKLKSQTDIEYCDYWLAHLNHKKPSLGLVVLAFVLIIVGLIGIFATIKTKETQSLAFDILIIPVGILLYIYVLIKQKQHNKIVEYLDYN